MMLMDAAGIANAWAQEVNFGCFVALPQKGGIENFPKSESCATKEIWLAKGESEGFILVTAKVDHPYKLEITPTDPESSLKFDVYRVNSISFDGSWGIRDEAWDRLEPLSFGNDISPRNPTELLWVRVHSPMATKPNAIALKISLQTDSKIYSTNANLRLVDLDLKNSPELFLQASISFPGTAGKKLDDDLLRMARYLRQWNISAISAGAKNLSDPEKVYLELFEKIGIRRLRMAFFNIRKFDVNAIRPGEKDDPWTKDTLLQLSRLRRLESVFGNKLQVKVCDEPGDKISIAQLKKTYEFVKKSSSSSLTELTAPPDSQLFGGVDIFMPRLQDIREQDVRQARNAGKDVYFYANTMHSIRRPSRTLRNIGWLAYKLGTNGYHIWCVNCWGRDLADGEISAQSHLGRGAFLYPAGDGNYQPSIRLEMLKDAMEDYQIFQAAKHHPKALQILLAALNSTYEFKQGRKSYENDARLLHDSVLQAVVHNN